jgi:AcrR family transcriptional regulator
MTEASRLFLAQGYHAMSMREIAQSVGVSKPALYYHFTDKESLFLALLLEGLAEAAAILAAARIAGPRSRDQVRAFLEGVLRMAPDHRAIVGRAGQEMVHLGPTARASFGELYHKTFIAQMEAMLMDGIAAGELQQVNPVQAAWLLLGMAYPFFSVGASTPAPGVAELIERTFFEGLGITSEPDPAQARPESPERALRAPVGVAPGKHRWEPGED